MNTHEFLRYKIREEDTLALLSKRVGMNPIDLENFHNSICSINEQIHFENLSYCEFIYLPLHHLSQQELQVEKDTEKPTKEFSTAFYFPKYNVQEIFNHNELLIDYSIKLDFEEEKGENIVSISRENLKKNDIIPDDKISLLALTCHQSISPLSFKISRNGEFFSFHNHQEIIKRFEEKRPELEDYQIGKIVENYLNMFESNIKNETYFLELIKKTLLYQVLFPKRNWFYKTTSWEDNFYLDNQLLLCKFSANYLHKDKIVHTIIKGETDNYGEFSFEYKTDRLTKKMLEAFAKITTENQDQTLKITQPT